MKGKGWLRPEGDTYRIVDGSRRNLTAGVWGCDDECGCRQLVIQAQFTHKLGPWNPWMTVWSGEFQSDYEEFTAEGLAEWEAACAEVGIDTPTA